MSQLALLAGADERTGAHFSPCGRYRYRLWRFWGVGPAVVWCMLNPSTADETQDDPTIRRCIGFARSWGAAGVVIVNLFALRSTDPAALYDCADPVGPANDGAILSAASAEASPVMAAWGVHGAHLGRGRAVAEMLGAHGVEIQCLGTTKDGHPRHPLYVRADARPVRWEVPRG